MIGSSFSSPWPQIFKRQSGQAACTIAQASTKFSKFFCTPWRPEEITFFTSRVALSTGANVFPLGMQIVLGTSQFGISSWVKTTN